MFRVSVAAVGTGLAADCGHEIPGVLAVLGTAGPRSVRPSYACIAGLPGCGVAGAGGVLSGRVLGSGLGSRWALAGVVPRRSALLRVAVLAGHARLGLVRG